ncbi:MAG TPA: hypothetical protein VF350_03385 [Candidatus Bathyarchaeia archaeon]
MSKLLFCRQLLKTIMDYIRLPQTIVDSTCKQIKAQTKKAT